MPDTCEPLQPTVKTKDILSAPSAGERDASLETQWDFVPLHAASENTSEDHRRSLWVKRRPPGQDMDPLCSFLMLRAQQASPVRDAGQSSYPNLINLFVCFLAFEKAFVVFLNEPKTQQLKLIQFKCIQSL